MSDEQLRQLIQNYNSPPAQVPRDEMWSRIRLARESNQPAAAPRNEMWERVAQVRSSRATARRKTLPLRPRIYGREVLVAGRSRWVFLSLSGLAAAALFAMVETRTVKVAGVTPRAEQVPVSQSTFEVPLPGFSFQNEGFVSYATELPSYWRTAAVDDPISEAYRRAAITHLKKSDALISNFRNLSNADLVARGMRSNVKELLSATRVLLNSPASIQAQYRGVFLDLEMVLVKISLLNPESVGTDRAQVETTVERKKLVSRMRDLIPAPTSSNAN